MIKFNAEDFIGKRLAKQELQKMIAQAIRQQPQWGEAYEDNFATFTIKYNGTDPDMKDYEGEIIYSITAYNAFQEIYDRVDDDLVENTDGKMDSAKDEREELEILNNLMEDENWDMDDVYDFIEEYVVIDMTDLLIYKAGNLIAVHEDEVINLEIE